MICTSIRSVATPIRSWMTRSLNPLTHLHRANLRTGAAPSANVPINGYEGATDAEFVRRIHRSPDGYTFLFVNSLPSLLELRIDSQEALLLSESGSPYPQITSCHSWASPARFRCASVSRTRPGDTPFTRRPAEPSAFLSGFNRDSETADHPPGSLPAQPSAVRPPYCPPRRTMTALGLRWCCAMIYVLFLPQLAETANPA